MREVVKWNRYFMDMAEATATRSKDPRTQVGAVIVDKDRRVVAQGYNGFPRGFRDTDECWERPLKYQYVCHAELNAVLNATTSIKDCTLYTTLAPCSNCAKYIANSGIRTVWYKEYKDDEDHRIAKEILEECEIDLGKLND